MATAETGRKTVGDEILEAAKRCMPDMELWCHRTRLTDPLIFWQGLKVPSIVAGLRSTATRLSDPVEFPSILTALEEFTTPVGSLNSMDDARVFVMAPLVHRQLLLQHEADLHSVASQNRALLPGRFVLAHLRLAEPAALTFNPTFAPADNVIYSQQRQI